MTVEQLAWVVPDLEPGIAHFTAAGVRHFARFEGLRSADVDARAGGAAADFIMDVAIGYLGDLQIELIRPAGGASIYQQHVDETGGGPHHIGYAPADLEAESARLAAEGSPEVIRFTSPVVTAVYHDTRARIGLMTELFRFTDDGRRFFEQLKTR